MSQRDGRRGGPRGGRPGEGYTLVELLAAVAVAGLVAAMGVSGFRAVREAVVLDRAQAAVRAQLGRARLLALSRGRTVRVRLAAGRELRLEAGGEVLDRLPLLSGGLALDSARLRPRTLRFNGRGQAAPGSVYLYRGGRGVRVVCNFLGRLRVERIAIRR